MLPFGEDYRTCFLLLTFDFVPPKPLVLLEDEADKEVCCRESEPAAPSLGRQIFDMMWFVLDSVAAEVASTIVYPRPLSPEREMEETECVHISHHNHANKRV